MLETLLVGAIVFALIYWAIDLLPVPERIQRFMLVLLLVVAVFWIVDFFAVDLNVFN